ncbi:hypothetical protein CCH79_00012483 [Gambusia affinis]|uniref:Septin-type G domain-containing protein n=1 Tax=Gambusia affinis TaxID=33528 RepID=A0A315WB59_GAMAF|nr:hypothetical protein CCH79_00012483 [Gambusia affinis]
MRQMSSGLGIEPATAASRTQGLQTRPLPLQIQGFPRRQSPWSRSVYCSLGKALPREDHEIDLREWSNSGTKHTTGRRVRRSEKTCTSKLSLLCLDMDEYHVKGDTFLRTCLALFVCVDAHRRECFLLYMYVMAGRKSDMSCSFRADSLSALGEMVPAVTSGSEVSLSHSNMSESAKPHHPNPQGKGEKSHGGDFSYVGIDAILEQMRRKAMKQGFELNLMVVGQSGLGKSTLMNTLFKSKVSRNKSVQSNPEERIPKTVEIKSISHDIEEKGVRMKLTVIDTPGFGDQINNENCWQPIMKFINDQYEAYLQEEININRKKRIPDSRVHCCIYFIPPTGHCLRPLDVEFMRRLSKVVNIVPVIAKADTLTLEERDSFKQTIREELRANGIDVYPQKEFDEDAEDRMINDKIREMIPFAVVGSDQEYQVNGKRLLGRKTKWGTIEVENIAHCEFAYLRDLLIRTHMQNIKDITGSIHYETYRVRRLNESNGHVISQTSDHLAVQPKANGQLEEQPSALQANGVAAQHEALSHEIRKKSTSMPT